MAYSHRPSILHRPQRAQPSRATEESVESQYEREQALLRAKSARQQEAHSRLLRSLHPQQEDKVAAWEELVAANSMLASRGQRDKELAPQSQVPSPGAQTALPDGARPWHHATATQQYSVEAEEAARRRFAAEVAAENQRLARERELARAMERHANRREPADPSTWYSRGDSHAYAQSVLFTGDGVPAPLRASCTMPVQTQPHTAGISATTSMAGAPPGAQQQQSRPGTAAAPWATWGDAETAAPQKPAPQAYQPAPQQPGLQPWAPKVQERNYPWSWTGPQ
ncbi:hypothetical protein HYH02_013444 [Chlamydomonas schloesseri]|uniref:Uncharacterized protein n=1 Tax=Chlamydomonas schloesseri TaxID=2026947 RepID=A0A835SZY3_9CHLO|nr:hypothetical protein HYH02_013444 [Chlamydomonas schloesseri]|eukprot:KAG2431314.1 hypothetical protein HYH02_013444 [Chlamydomonas schloesseri]